uniref:DUF6349 family protein n=1 Tax=Kitasatospora sp. NBC_01519 TaxID=2903576 RepID=UPI002F90E4E4
MGRAAPQAGDDVLIDDNDWLTVADANPNTLRTTNGGFHNVASVYAVRRNAVITTAATVPPLAEVTAAPERPTEPSLDEDGPFTDPATLLRAHQHLRQALVLLEALIRKNEITAEEASKNILAAARSDFASVPSAALTTENLTPPSDLVPAARVLAGHPDDAKRHAAQRASRDKDHNVRIEARIDAGHPIRAVRTAARALHTLAEHYVGRLEATPEAELITLALAAGAWATGPDVEVPDGWAFSAAPGPLDEGQDVRVQNSDGSYSIARLRETGPGPWQATDLPTGQPRTVDAASIVALPADQAPDDPGASGDEADPTSVLRRAASGEWGRTVAALALGTPERNTDPRRAAQALHQIATSLRSWGAAVPTPIGALTAPGTKVDDGDQPFFDDADHLREHYRQQTIPRAHDQRAARMRHEERIRLSADEHFSLSEGGRLVIMRAGERPISGRPNRGNDTGWEIRLPWFLTRINNLGKISTRTHAQMVASALESITNADGSPFSWDAPEVDELIRDFRDREGRDLAEAIVHTLAVTPGLDDDGTFARTAARLRAHRKPASPLPQPPAPHPQFRTTTPTAPTPRPPLAATPVTTDTGTPEEAPAPDSAALRTPPAGDQKATAAERALNPAPVSAATTEHPEDTLPAPEPRTEGLPAPAAAPAVPPAPAAPPADEQAAWHIAHGHPTAVPDYGAPDSHWPSVESRGHEHRGACLCCSHRGPARSDQASAVADALDHTHPGWRTTPVFASPFWMEAVSLPRRSRDTEAWVRASQAVLPEGWVDTAGPVRVHGAEPAVRPPSSGSGRYEVITTEPVHVSITRDKAGQGILTFPPTPGTTRPTDAVAARSLLTAAAEQADDQRREALRMAHQAKTLASVADGLFVTFHADNRWNLMPAGGALTPLPPALRRFISKAEAIEFADRAAILLHTPPLAGATPPLDFADPQFEEALARHLAGIGAHPSTLAHLLLATRAGLERDHQRYGSHFAREWAPFEHNPNRAAPQDGHAWADELEQGDWISITIPGHPTRQVARIVAATTDTLGAVYLDLDIEGTLTSHTVARNTSIAGAIAPQPDDADARATTAEPKKVAGTAEVPEVPAAVEEPTADAVDAAAQPTAAGPSPDSQDPAIIVRTALLARLDEYQDILDSEPGMARLARDAAPGPVIDEQVLYLAVTLTPEGVKVAAALGHEPDPNAAAWTAAELRAAGPNDLLAALSAPAVVEPHTQPDAVPAPQAPTPAETPTSERLHQLLAAAQHLLVNSLSTGARSEPARRYLAERGVPADSPIAAHWGIGYAPGGSGTYLTDALRAQGFTDAELLAAGVSADGNRGLFDALRNRVTFPILSRDGHVTAFTGRALRESATSPKWVNTRNTALYTKAEALLGPGHHRQALNDRGPFVIAEGAFDLVAVGEALRRDDRPAPIPAGPCGTALTEQQVQVLATLDGQRDIVLVFDPDEAGDKALRAAWDLLRNWQGRVFAVRLPAGNDPRVKNDPGRIFETQGPDALYSLMLAHLQPALDAVLDAELAPLAGDPNRAWKAIETAVELILESGDPQQISRQLPRLAVLGLDMETLAEEIERELSHLADQALGNASMRELRAAREATAATAHPDRTQRPTMTSPEAAVPVQPEGPSTNPHATEQPEPVPAPEPAPEPVPPTPAPVGSPAWLAYWAEQLPEQLPTNVAPIERVLFLNLVRDLAFRLVDGPDHLPGLQERVIEATEMFARGEGDQAVRQLITAAGEHPKYEEVGRVRQILAQTDFQNQPTQPVNLPEPGPKEEPSVTTPVPSGRADQPDDPYRHVTGEPSDSPDGPTFATGRQAIANELKRTNLTAEQRLELQERWIISAHGEDNENRASYGEPVNGVFPGTQRRVWIDRDFTAPEPSRLVAGAPAGQDPVGARLALIRHLTTRAAQEATDRPDIAAAFRDTAQQLRLEVTGRPSDRPGAPVLTDPPPELITKATRIISLGATASPLPLWYHLGVDYAAAEKLLDAMEKAGAVGPLTPGATLRTVRRGPTPKGSPEGAAPQPQAHATTPAQTNPAASTTAGPDSPDNQTTPMDQLTDTAAAAITETAGGTQSATEQIENLRREVAALRAHVEQMFTPEDAAATQTTAPPESPDTLTQAIGAVERDAAWYLNMPQWLQIQSIQAAAMDAWSTISEHLQRAPGEARLERLARAVTALGAQGISAAAFSLGNELAARGHRGSPAWTALRNLVLAADGLRARVLGRQLSPETAQEQAGIEADLQAFAKEMRTERRQQAADTPPQAAPAQPPAEPTAKPTDQHGLTWLRSASQGIGTWLTDVDRLLGRAGNRAWDGIMSLWNRMSDAIQAAVDSGDRFATDLRTVGLFKTLWLRAVEKVSDLLADFTDRRTGNNKPPTRIDELARGARQRLEEHREHLRGTLPTNQTRPEGYYDDTSFLSRSRASQTLRTERRAILQDLQQPNLAPHQQLALQERWIVNAHREDALAQDFERASGAPHAARESQLPLPKHAALREPSELVAGFRPTPDPITARADLARHLDTRADQLGRSNPEQAQLFRDVAQGLRLEITGRPQVLLDGNALPPESIRAAARIIAEGAPASPLLLRDRLDLSYGDAELALQTLDSLGIVGPIPATGQQGTSLRPTLVRPDQIASLDQRLAGGTNTPPQPRTQQQPPAHSTPLADLTPAEVRSTLRAFAQEQLRRVGPNTPEGKSAKSLLDSLDSKTVKPITRNTQNRATAPVVLASLQAVAANPSAARHDSEVMRQLAEAALQGAVPAGVAARRGPVGPAGKRQVKAGARPVQQRPQSPAAGHRGPA